MPKTLTSDQLAAWRGLLTVQSVTVSQIEERLDAEKLPPLGWYDVLFALHEQPEKRLRMADLASAVLLSRSGLTRLVDRLESEGLLRREACATDKRGWNVCLTDAGTETLRRIWPVYRAGISDFFVRHLTEEEVTLLNGIFTKITARLTDQTP